MIPENVSAKLGESSCDELRELLAQDPRPGYRHDESADDLSKIYGMNFSADPSTLTTGHMLSDTAFCHLQSVL